jgi:hypothetical protein
MSGWIIPPPGRPTKSAADLRREREAKVAELARRRLLRSERLRGAMLSVRREDFIPLCTAITPTRRFRCRSVRASDDLLPAPLSAVL